MSLREEDIRKMKIALAEVIVENAIVSGDETPKQSDKETIDNFITILEDISRLYNQPYDESSKNEPHEGKLSGGRRMTRKVGGQVRPLIRGLLSGFSQLGMHTKHRGTMRHIRGFGNLVQPNPSPILNINEFDAIHNLSLIHI